ncbi:hypothetical protein NDU88_007118, partial [Pleurodeles waltl]
YRDSFVSLTPEVRSFCTYCSLYKTHKVYGWCDCPSLGHHKEANNTNQALSSHYGAFPQQSCGYYVSGSFCFIFVVMHPRFEFSFLSIFKMGALVPSVAPTAVYGVEGCI